MGGFPDVSLGGDFLYLLDDLRSCRDVFFCCFLLGFLSNSKFHVLECFEEKVS